MDMLSLISLFGILLVLAAIPSASVALVVTRSATHGLQSGLAATLGIVLADLCFILLAILGMTVVAEAVGSVFVLIRFAAAAYLIWMGISLIRSALHTNAPAPAAARQTHATSFAAGFFLTLGDVKAILFYASLFPAFVDLTALTLLPGIALVVFTVAAVGSIKALYAVAARCIVHQIRNPRLQQTGRAGAGTLMVGTGITLLAKG